MMTEQRRVQQEQLRGSHPDLQVGGTNTENDLKPQVQEPRAHVHSNSIGSQCSPDWHRTQRSLSRTSELLIPQHRFSLL